MRRVSPAPARPARSRPPARRVAGDEGIALMLVLVFVLVVAVLVTALLNQAYTNFRAARVTADIQNRVYAADGGIDWAIQQLRDGIAIDDAPACAGQSQGTQTLGAGPLVLNTRSVTVTCTVTAGGDDRASGWAAFITDPLGGLATQPTAVNDKPVFGPVYNAGSFTAVGASTLRVHNGRFVQLSGSCAGKPATIALHPSPPYTYSCRTTPVATPAPPVPVGRLPNYFPVVFHEDPQGQDVGPACRSFAPGHYTAAPEFLSSVGGAVNQLRSGVYALDNVGTIDLTDAIVIGGSPGPGETAATSVVADALAAGCHVQTGPETDGHYGVVLVLGGNSTIRIRNQSRVELFGYYDPDGGTTGALSVVQLPASIEPARASTITLANGPIVQMAPGSRSWVAVHGGVYTPTARVSAFGTSEAWVSLQGGVVAAALDLQAAPGPTNFAVSTQVGASSRTIRLEATTNRVGSEKQIRAVADVVAVNDASRTVTVTSWKVEQ